MDYNRSTTRRKYDVLYTSRKRGNVKHELVKEDMEKIVAYLCEAHRCKEEEIRVDQEYKDWKE